MQFFKFYGLVFREAFRHSLDLTQTVLFVAIFFAGLIAYGNPEAKTVIDAFDLNGWKITAFVFGFIVAARLIFAPYWLWKAERSHRIIEPNSAINFQFRVQGLSNEYDKSKKAVRIGFILHNSFSAPIRYEVEEIYVTITDEGNDNPRFANRGGVVPLNKPITFHYDWIFLKKMPKPGDRGIARITYKYGIAGQTYVRRAHFVCRMTFQRNALEHKPIEDTEVSI